jgi:NAD(P)-dependent dehydrogenase (short-subunit alcohol dehydrogenase family)
MNALHNKVAVISGAGRGIGRSHALLFAREGAAVVVNDLGAHNDGVGSDSAPAQDVVDEIRAAGGRAVANTDDIATWSGAKRLVEQAVEEFGRLDIVVNNAGILRDAFLVEMSEEDWDAVVTVHLKGHAAVMRHAAAYWRSESRAGRPVRASVVNTCSASGTFVVLPRQSNYGAAKAGIAALTRVAAEELERYGVRVNAVAPIARTRLSLTYPVVGPMFAEDVPEGKFDSLSPDNIAPLAVYLASDECTISGMVFAVQGGQISRLEPWNVGETIDVDGAWELDDIHNRLAPSPSRGT